MLTLCTNKILLRYRYAFFGINKVQRYHGRTVLKGLYIVAIINILFCGKTNCKCKLNLQNPAVTLYCLTEYDLSLLLRVGKLSSATL